MALMKGRCKEPCRELESVEVILAVDVCYLLKDGRILAKILSVLLETIYFKDI